MGHSSLYHPVSLQVLRGALKYNGFTVGKFSQVLHDQERGTASYDLPVIQWDRSLQGSTINEIHSAINASFAADVECQRVWVTPAGTYMARLKCTTTQENFLESVP